MDFWWPSDDERVEAGIDLWQRRGWAGEGPYPEEVEHYLAHQDWFFSLHTFKGVMDWERWSRTGHVSPHPPPDRHVSTDSREWF